ncbi:Stf0 family sulfotransferase [Flexibacterium corallicola]|uniref:Stf0 family sulfotransferase n=1 Tax=Flexibacterium corallicola TaxID=3037259 RepID=UPI00286F1281|nr:Stf0 family sulfotransferase [Pseudovibrio sp. M1P-2-3]
MDREKLTEFCVHKENIEKFFGKHNCDLKTLGLECHSITLLVFTNRSGSNLLGNYLASTSEYFGFEEFLNYDTVITRSKNNKIESFADYFRFLSQSDSGCTLGIKASINQVKMLDYFGLFESGVEVRDWISIKREDILGQAISWVIAQQTKQWASFQKNSSNVITYDFNAIHNAIKYFTHQYELIDNYFKQIDGRKFQLTYEELVKSPEAAIGNITHLPANFKFKQEVIKFKKQANEINDRFRYKYVEDLKSLGVIS